MADNCGRLLRGPVVDQAAAEDDGTRGVQQGQVRARVGVVDDPRTDLALLDAPRAVILRGRLVHHRAAG